MMTIRIPQLHKFRAAMARFPKDMRREMQIGILQASKLIWKSSREFVRFGTGYTKRPYDSGEMMRSITREVRPLEAVIGPRVDYAIYPHEGYSTSRGYGRRPFMEDSLDKNIGEIEDIFVERIEKVLRKI